jgi:hypothetical protein
VTLSHVPPLNGIVNIADNGPVPPFVLTFRDSRDGAIRSTVLGAGLFQVAVLSGDYRVEVSGLPEGYSLSSITYRQGETSTNVLGSPLTVRDTPGEIGINLGVSSPPPWVKLGGRFAGPGLPDHPVQLVLRRINTRQEFETPLRPDGTFAFERILPGTYHASFAPNLAGVHPIGITVPSRDTTLQIPMPARVTVKGNVTAEHGAVLPQSQVSLAGVGQPPQVSLVEFLPVNKVVDVAADGTFSTIVPAGSYRIAVKGIAAPYAVRGIRDGATDLLKAPLQIAARDSAKNIRVDLSVSTFALRGRLYMGQSPLPQEIRVALSGTGLLTAQRVAISPDGAFVFPNTPPGTYTVRLLPQGVSVPVTVESSDVAGIDFGFQSGQVSNASPPGQSPPPMSVMFYSGGKLIAGPLVNPDGTFGATLPRGQYLVRLLGVSRDYMLRSFSDGAIDLLQKDLDFSPSSARPIRAVLDTVPPVRVSGRVTRPENAIRTAPLRVELSRIGAPGRLEAPVNPDGSFEFREVMPSSYLLGLPLELGIARPILVDAERDVSGVAISIPRQVPIRGRVVMEDGSPLPDLSASGMTVAAVGDGLTAFAVIAPDGAFTTSSTEGEQLIQIRSIPAGYRVKSLTAGSVDLLQLPITLNSPVEIRVVLTPW